MSPFWSVYLQALPVIIGVMTVMWLLSVMLKNAGIVDPFWGTGFVIIAWFYFFQADNGLSTRKLLITILTTIWGLRLSLYLLWRQWGKDEDFRYQGFRQKYGPERYWWVSFFQVFLLQGVLLWLVSAPLLGAQTATRSTGLTLLDWLGVAVWLLGFIFEAGGDWQLARFKAQPANKGKLLTSGFWRYTRHPNYFGDTAVWWGYGLISIAAGSIIPFLGTLLMTYLIIRISGVAMLERSLKSEKPGYEAHIRRTNAFISWFPKP